MSPGCEPDPTLARAGARSSPIRCPKGVHMSQHTVASKEDLYDSLEQYASERREEIDKRDLGRDTGLIKSYLLETTRHDGEADIPAALARTDLRAERLGDGDA